MERFRYSSPPLLVKLIQFHKIVLSYKIGMLDQRGEGCRNAQKQIVIKAH